MTAARRSITSLLTATTVVATLGAGLGISQSAYAATKSSTSTASAVRTRAQVPWSQVGDNWSALSIVKGGHTNLVLESPTGQAYLIATTLKSGESVGEISHSGRYVQTFYMAPNSIVSQIRIWDLRTGRITATLPAGATPTSFTRPTGSAINVVAGDNSFERITVAGKRELRVTKLPGMWFDLPHPGGLLDAGASDAGTAVTLYNHVTMRAVRTYAEPKGAHDCYPTAWANSTTLLENCTLKNDSNVTRTEIYEQNIKGGAPVALTSGTWPGDPAASFGQGFLDARLTKVGTIATTNNEESFPSTANVFRISKGKVVATIKPPLAADVAKGVYNAEVIGNTVLYTPWHSPSQPVTGLIASYNLVTKKAAYLAGSHSQFGGFATGVSMIDPAE